MVSKFNPSVWQEMSKGERIMLILSVLLIILGFIENTAFAGYIIPFRDSTYSGCCGIISRPGSVCFRDDIQNGNIDTVNVNGSIFCEINGVLCDTYSFEDNTSNNTEVHNDTLRQCFGADAMMDSCGSNAINEQMTINISEATNALNWCYAAIFFWCFVTTILCLDIGGFHEMEWCEHNKRTYLCCIKCLEMTVWIIYLIAIQVEVQDVATNGYEQVYIAMSDPSDQQNQCQEIGKTAGILWINYIDTPDFAQSPFFDVIAFIGITITSAEFVFVFFAYFCCGPRAKAVWVKKGMSGSIN